MTTYNYYQAVREDILENIRDNHTLEEIREKLEDLDTWHEELYDTLWVEDSVTGNGSGSYTFNRNVARDYVQDNLDLLREALREFCVESQTIADKFMSEDWEYFDITIRCYLLGGGICAALAVLEEEAKEAVQ